MWHGVACYNDGLFPGSVLRCLGVSFAVAKMSSCHGSSNRTSEEHREALLSRISHDLLSRALNFKHLHLVKQDGRPVIHGVLVAACHS
jgi:hypothetical protein